MVVSHESEKPVGSVFFLNGQLVLKALPGFEHLFPPGFEASFQARPPSPSLSPSPMHSDFKTEGGATFKKTSSWTTVKRAKRPCPEPEVEKPPPKRARSEKKSQVHEFRIGDVEGMRRFYFTRLGEVGINALRRIITEWVKVLEPTRLRNYGPYHKLKQYSWDFKLLDSVPVPKERGPPWWPNDVPYVEPAHLPSKCLESLGVAIMFLQFSSAEQAKEYHAGESLISKLHNAAKYFISTLPAQEYAMGHDAWNAVMKERALQTILPELLQVARDYEEHLLQQGRDEGEREPSPALGRIFTYAELQKPVRKSWRGQKGRDEKKAVEEKEREDKEREEMTKKEREMEDKMTKVVKTSTEMKGYRIIKTKVDKVQELQKVNKVMALDNLLNA
ncbi:hypothetical protein P280DRAFT_478480 [Massarina eburnea CBS 473.64]|uniref:Subtelomeric hrmA-associated cluster protein AFUB-079030/YDR124W-like helical bundle domain-containing protein n=1 Tax=Massarina eburnea CBS 473.64 TaxID=1395130 RepID=A0A6A6S5A2_9PLEO|nr:hypothetical protein P280DRAFT_478480 [Massarina eburnea CBS 473.64]